MNSFFSFGLDTEWKITEKNHIYLAEVIIQLLILQIILVITYPLVFKGVIQGIFCHSCVGNSLICGLAS